MVWFRVNAASRSNVFSRSVKSMQYVQVTSLTIVRLVAEISPFEFIVNFVDSAPPTSETILKRTLSGASVFPSISKAVILSLVVSPAELVISSVLSDVEAMSIVEEVSL